VPAGQLPPAAALVAAPTGPVLIMETGPILQPGWGSRLGSAAINAVDVVEAESKIVTML
jgi:hypothetical protein